MAPHSLIAGLFGTLLLAVPTHASILGQRVSDVSDAGVPLFKSETFQLTEKSLRSLKSSQKELFGFQGDNTSANADARAKCRLLPGDKAWPSESTWSELDSALGGALIKTVPLAASCYPSWPEYDSAKCTDVGDDWEVSYMHAADPASIMWPLFEGRSCLPTSMNTSSTCTIGGYSSYAVNVSTVAQVQLAVNFARNSNLRLVVKNTGHDFNGKSTGAGALGVWTHNLKEIEYIEEYNGATYQGAAVKLGAGIQAFEIYEKAEELGFTAVGGEGKTVGVAGGYVLGGGHSPMSSMYGLAADQVLAMEVVLADGTFTTVTEETDPDLFWAIRGGGGGTFGVVTSVISRVYPKVGVTVSTFTFTTGTDVSADTFWDGVRAYFSRFARFADAGTYAYFWILNLGDDSYEFMMNPFFAVNHTVAEFNALIEPWVSDLEDLGITVTPNSTYYESFHPGWEAGFPLEEIGLVTMMTGSRLFPRENFDAKLNETVEAVRTTVGLGHSLLAFNMKTELQDGFPENSANPAFRQSLMHAITSSSWDTSYTTAEINSTMYDLTYNVLDTWRATCPESGAYMSESDILEPNFQQAFYGSNYPRLFKLKQLYDPEGVFYAPTGVGSEYWNVESLDGLPDQNGRLCRV
ncbi:FAD linked oxidase N-terminal [Penicillium herquei]|nr:FAD linked oxidase N-terminal [Penicillium herquei]